MDIDDRYFCNGCEHQILKEKKIFEDYKKEVPYCTVFKEWINFDMRCRNCLLYEVVKK